MGNRSANHKASQQVCSEDRLEADTPIQACIRPRASSFLSPKYIFTSFAQDRELPRRQGRGRLQIEEDRRRRRRRFHLGSSASLVATIHVPTLSGLRIRLHNYREAQS
jgi:hypothetical protein